jgi:rhomboid protease GluP
LSPTERFLLVIIAISIGLSMIAVLARRGIRLSGYLFLLLANEAVAIASIVRNDTGILFYLAIFLFVLLVLVPSILSGSVRRAVQAGRAERALKLLRVRQLLQPGIGLDREYQLISELLLVQQGRLDQALALAQAQLEQGGLEQSAQLLIVERLITLLVFDRRWEEAILLFEEQGGMSLASASPRVCGSMVRAYAEVDRMAAAARCMAILEQSPCAVDPAAAELCNLARLDFLAHLGQVEAVRELMAEDSSFLSSISAPRRGLWLALALARSGDGSAARSTWQAIAEQADDGEAARTARGHLEQTGDLRTAQELTTPEIAALVAEVSQRTLAYRQIPTARASTPFWRRAPVSAVLLVILSAVFVTQLLAGTADDSFDMMRWGVNFPQALFAGEYWRAITSMYLHHNVLHFALNAYALYLLGGLVERMFHSSRFFVIYTGAGIVGSLTSALAASGFRFSVGASGAIFGLLGAALVGLRRLRGTVPEEWRRRLTTNLMLVIGMQIILGFSIKMIDNAAHMGGLGGGALLALLVTPRSSVSGPLLRYLSLALAGLAGVVTVGAAMMAGSTPVANTITRLATRTFRHGGLSATCPIHWQRMEREAGFALQDVLFGLNVPTLILKPGSLVGVELQVAADRHAQEAKAALERVEAYGDVVTVNKELDLDPPVVGRRIGFRAEKSMYEAIFLYRQQGTMLVVAELLLPRDRVEDYAVAIKRISATMRIDDPG